MNPSGEASSDGEREVDLEAEQAGPHAVVVAPEPDFAGQRVDEGIEFPAVPEERRLAGDVDEFACEVVGRVEAEEGVRAGRDVGGLMHAALVALAGIGRRKPAVLEGAPFLGLFRGRLRNLDGRGRGSGCLLLFLRDAEVVHDDEQLDDRLSRVVALRGEAFEGHLVRIIGEVLAMLPVGRRHVPRRRRSCRGGRPTCGTRSRGCARASRWPVPAFASEASRCGALRSHASPDDAACALPRTSRPRSASARTSRTRPCAPRVLRRSRPGA